ncbi:hypothetical protein SCB29_35915, partial [Paraburkholderia sp. SIMBA_055]
MITSPLTDEGDGECYTSKPGGGREAITDGARGVFEAHVPLTRDTTILVENADGENAVVAPDADTDTRSSADTIFGWKGIPATDVLDAQVDSSAEEQAGGD